MRVVFFRNLIGRKGHEKNLDCHDFRDTFRAMARKIVTKSARS